MQFRGIVRLIICVQISTKNVFSLLFFKSKKNLFQAIEIWVLLPLCVHGEVMLWGSHGEFDDHMDEFIRMVVDKSLAAELKELESIDADIRKATDEHDKDEVFRLHGDRYRWLRSQYLEGQKNTADSHLAKVRVVVLTTDLAIKIFARLSQRHKKIP